MNWRKANMENVIEVMGLTKKYKGFLLDRVSFNVPGGYVCGFIGQNGAGKTTTLKLLVGLASKDGGEARILGKPHEDSSIKEDLGILFDQQYYQEDWTPLRIEETLRPFYSNWDSMAFQNYLKKFSLDPRQKFKTLSRGMKMKLGMAVALSHNAKLLLLDEPTSGIDPVMRDQLLDTLREYMVGENRSVFFSTHITSDLDKVADYIVYIHRGRIVFSGLKDELVESYCMIRGGFDDLQQKDKENIIGYREHVGGFDGLVKTSDTGGLSPGVITENAGLDDIMVYMDRGYGDNGQ